MAVPGIGVDYRANLEEKEREEWDVSNKGTREK